MKKQPIIGITMCSKPDGVIDFLGVDYMYVRREYSKVVSGGGAVPILLTPDITPQMAANLCDGIVITGGYDIPAELYGESRHKSMVHVETMERVKWELALIDACDEADIPILGICYGMQLMNVHFGGSLYQDIASQIPASGKHRSGTPVNEHMVTFLHDFLGFKTGETVPTASRHHQAVNRIADGWNVVARSADGVVEAMQKGRHFGVQWHAESDLTAGRIYGEFIAVCKKKAPLPPVFENVVEQIVQESS